MYMSELTDVKEFRGNMYSFITTHYKKYCFYGQFLSILLPSSVRAWIIEKNWMKVDLVMDGSVYWTAKQSYSF